MFNNYESFGNDIELNSIFNKESNERDRFLGKSQR